MHETRSIHDSMNRLKIECIAYINILLGENISFVFTITLCPFYFSNHLDEEEREMVALLLLPFGCLVTVNV